MGAATGAGAAACSLATCPIESLRTNFNRCSSVASSSSVGTSSALTGTDAGTTVEGRGALSACTFSVSGTGGGLGIGKEVPLGTPLLTGVWASSAICAYCSKGSESLQDLHRLIALNIICRSRILRGWDLHRNIRCYPDMINLFLRWRQPFRHS